MITLAVLAVLVAVLLLALCLGATVLLDPIIAILVLVLIGKGISKLFKKKAK